MVATYLCLSCITLQKQKLKNHIFCKTKQFKNIFSKKINKIYFSNQNEGNKEYKNLFLQNTPYVLQLLQFYNYNNNF